MQPTKLANKNEREKKTQKKIETHYRGRWRAQLQRQP